MTSSEIASGDNSERDDDAGPPRLAGLPEYILAAIVGFAADLPTRLLRRGVVDAYACVAACRALRDACSLSSPPLDQSLVLRRFPMAGHIRAGPRGRGAADQRALAPRELFRAFANFEDALSVYAAASSTLLRLRVPRQSILAAHNDSWCGIISDWLAENDHFVGNID